MKDPKRGHVPELVATAVGLVVLLGASFLSACCLWLYFKGGRER